MTPEQERFGAAVLADMRHILTQGPTYHTMPGDIAFVAAEGLVDLGLLSRDGWAANGRARFVRTALGDTVARGLGADIRERTAEDGPHGL